MSWLRDISLGVKLNLLVLLVLGILLASVIGLLSRNTQTLTEEVGGEQIAEEANILESRLAEIEENLLIDINFLVTSVNFWQAVGNRDISGTENIIDPANDSLKLDDIDVIDGDGRRLVDIDVDANPEEDALLDLGLSGTQTTALLIEDHEGITEISIVAVAPVESATGNRLGAILMSRHINSAFLEQLTFGRSAVQLGLIYNDKIQVRTSGSEDQAAASDTILNAGIAFDQTQVQEAQNGQSIIKEDLAISDESVPHTVAYTPVLAGTETSPVVIMILVELRDIYAFQRTTLTNTIVIFGALTLIALFIIYITFYQTTLRPLNRLKTIAQTMTEGQYDQRVPDTAKDEVGQLGQTFNEMASAVQQREISLQAAREQAEQADKVKSMFLASMSHELRTPLNAIINLTKFVGIGMYGPVNEEQADALKKTEASGKHLLELINDVLDISKIESGSLELFVENDIKIDEITRMAVETCRSLLVDKAVDLSSEISADLPQLMGDEQRIRQVLFNLLSNACKFTEEGMVTIRAYQKDGEVQISVCDTGPGIEAEDHDAIFEVFRQSKAGLRKGGGTGLGLPISRRLVEAHGGRMWLESAPGKGSTFYVALPIVSSLELTI
jgi:signal transduction histidine kinase